MAQGSRSGRKPDYQVGAINKITGQKSSKVGGAWKNDNGTISVVLDAFVVFPGGSDTLLTLFPNTEWTERQNQDSEIPF